VTWHMALPSLLLEQPPIALFRFPPAGIGSRMRADQPSSRRLSQATAQWDTLVSTTLSFSVGEKEAGFPQQFCPSTLDAVTTSTPGRQAQMQMQVRLRCLRLHCYTGTAQHLGTCTSPCQQQRAGLPRCAHAQLICAGPHRDWLQALGLHVGRPGPAEGQDLRFRNLHQR
jgi:hypothetical protein